MARPSHLPDFLTPPLDEVVIGAQFTPPPKYTSVYAKSVWDLYRGEFPMVEDHHALEPSFETFGGLNVPPSVQFRVMQPPARGRQWFVSEKQDHLIQFQEDRLLVNWRRNPSGETYPHFESIASSFQDYLERLESFNLSEFEHQMVINQADVSYHNTIPVDDFSDIGDWLNIWGFGSLQTESFNTNYTEAITDKNGKPYARLSHQIQSVFTTDGKEKALRLTLSFRGLPDGTDVAACMKFIESGREAIVTRFDQMTTEKAHQFWEKK